MRPPWEWTEDDVRALIADKVEESLTLDYKACDALAKSDAKKRELSKDVSAFANSAGGVIVYGVAEKNHLPTTIDTGYPPDEISKEWIEQVVNSNIQRRIDGIRIKPIQLSGASAGRVIYAVSIPQSVRAPHMAADHRFYKRFNFESVPMEEYEVRDVAHRTEAPDLSLDLHWERPALPAPIAELRPFIVNDAPEPATHVVIRLYVDARITIFDTAGLGGPVPHHLSSDQGEVAVGMLSLKWSPPLGMPIWEGEPFGLTDAPIRFGLPRVR